MQLSLRHDPDEEVDRLLGHPVEFLHVQQRTVLHRFGERSGQEGVAGVALGKHPGRVELARQPGRCQLGVALDGDQGNVQRRGQGSQQRGLAGAGRTLQQEMAPRADRGHHQLDLAPAPHHGSRDGLHQATEGVVEAGNTGLISQRR